MTATDLLRSAARLELRIVRVSLDVVDRTVLSRVGGDSPAHELIGRVRRTISRLEDCTPTERSTPAAPATNTAPSKENDAEEAPVTDAGSAVLTDQELTTAEDLADSYLAAEEGHVAGELAEDDELRRVQAELRAKHALQENDELKDSQ